MSAYAGRDLSEEASDFAEHFDPVFVVKQELTMNRHKIDVLPKKVKRLFDKLPPPIEPRPLQEQERRNEFTLETLQRSRALQRPPVLEAGPLAFAGEPCRLPRRRRHRPSAASDWAIRQGDAGSVKSLEEKGVLELYADEETGIKGAMITAKGVGVWGYFQIWEKTPEQRL